MKKVLLLVAVLATMCSGAFHKNERGSSMHTPFRWTVADATARDALSVTAADTMKAALQLSDTTLWVLIDDSPKTWREVGGQHFKVTGDTMTGPIAMGANSISYTGAAGAGVIFNSDNIPVFYNVPVTSGDLRATVILRDTTPYAAGNGGGVAFSGKSDAAGTYYAFAGIKGVKANGIDGNNEGWLALMARANGGSPTTELWIMPDSVVAVNRVTSPIIGDTVVDYAVTSTIVGWTSFTTKTVHCQKSGKVIHVWFDIKGVSNSTETSFTLPDAPTSSAIVNFQCVVRDNGGTLVVSYGFMNSSFGSKVFLQPLVTSASPLTWTASGNKSVYGQFTYFID